jgi:uncharacterized protein (DUF934 family)
MILANEKVITRALGQGNPSEVIVNEFVHCLIATPAKGEQAEELNLSDLPNQKVSVPLSFWNEHKAELLALEHEVAVQLGAADFAEDIKNDLIDVKTIVLPFENFVDGRSYSHAYLLRTRYKFEGEIRAVGDVHYDLVNFLARCGVDAFELPEGEDLEAAREAFEIFSETYQPSADGGNLVFARRRAVH